MCIPKHTKHDLSHWQWLSISVAFAHAQSPTAWHKQELVHTQTPTHVLSAYLELIVMSSLLCTVCTAVAAEAAGQARLLACVLTWMLCVQPPLVALWQHSQHQLRHHLLRHPRRHHRPAQVSIHSPGVTDMTHVCLSACLCAFSKLVYQLLQLSAIARMHIKNPKRCSRSGRGCVSGW